MICCVFVFAIIIIIILSCSSPPLPFGAGWLSHYIVTYCCSISFGTSLQFCAISHINVHVSPFVHRSHGYMCFSILFYLFLYLFGLITNVIFAVGDGNGIESTVIIQHRARNCMTLKKSERIVKK